ncbi:MAG: hypothetical protein ACKO8Q_00065 [Bacteroidota bacterium]|jgi:hypothetical protein
MFKAPLLIIQAVMVGMFFLIGTAAITLEPMRDILPGSQAYWFAGVLYVYAIIRSLRIRKQYLQLKRGDENED